MNSFNDEPREQAEASPQAEIAVSGAPVPAPGPAVQVMRIVAGVHCGASRRLGAQELLVIGSGDDCDIVLADAGVAKHHAIISVLGGRISIRAVDSPLRVGGRPLHPGDPIDLPPLARIEIGDATLALGDEHHAGWTDLLPAGDGKPVPTAKRLSRAALRRLPAVAAIAVLSLASVAIFAAVIPPEKTGPEPREQLGKLIKEYGIIDGRSQLDGRGNWVLSGTVLDDTARALIQRRLAAEDLHARLDLRTGDDVARDVREVLRSNGLTAQARYLDNGRVEIKGAFPDTAVLNSAVLSRAMFEVRGVKKILPVNLAPPESKPAAVKHFEAVTIVSVVKDGDPHVVASDGSRYGVGATLPDGRELVAIGDKVWAMADGKISQIRPTPTDATVPGGPGTAAATATGTGAAFGSKIARGIGTVPKRM